MCVKQANRQSMPKMHEQSGLTLIELVLSLIIVSTLATISYPVFDNQLEKGRLAELVLRIDAMRTASIASIERGNPALLQFNKVPSGQVPPELTGIIDDSLQYPGLVLMVLRTAKDFHQFAGGVERPYLMVSVAGTEDLPKLRNLSEILPENRWAWWVQSTVMMIPLVDDQFLSSPAGTAGSLATGGSGTTATGVSTTGAPPTTTPDAGTGTDATPQPDNSGSPPGQSYHNACSHPGNGHAYGRCRN